MEFNNNVEGIVKYLLPIFNKTYCSKKPKLELKEKKLKKIFSSLFNDIKEGFQFVINKLNSNCLKPVFQNKYDVQNKLSSTKYFPQEIKDYINNNGRKFICYTCKIGERIIKIHFMLFSESDELEVEKYDKYVYKMLIWLYICNKYTVGTNNKNINIYLYLTPYKKYFPSKSSLVLGPININTAYTYPCVDNGEIVIYREEEWMKVFIHETIHSYCFDVVLHNSPDIVNRVLNIFPIKIELQIAETYTETLARIINAGLYCYNELDKKTDKDTFYLYMNFVLNLERLYALHQIDNILSFMGLQYTDLYEKTDTSEYLRLNLYRENTNVFAYYILTGILLNNYEDFCIWCDNGTNFYKLNESPLFRNLFFKLIENNYKSKLLLDELRLINLNKKKQRNQKRYNKHINKTLRMSISEF